jgi:hypothetical protein
MAQLTHAERQDYLSWCFASMRPPVGQRSLHSTQRLPVMGLAASIHWISQRISSGNTDESESRRGRETVLGFHAGKVGHANAARLKSTASRTCSKDGEPYTLQGVRTVRRGGHAIPTGSTVPTLLNVELVGARKFLDGMRTGWLVPSFSSYYRAQFTLCLRKNTLVPIMVGRYASSREADWPSRVPRTP